jgi:transposase
MQLKAILNRIQKHRGFVYGPTRLVGDAPDLRLEVDIYPHRRSRPRCSQCRRRGPQL